jgi:multicomponent Na+:H+ antiporter subunit F
VNVWLWAATVLIALMLPLLLLAVRGIPMDGLVVLEVAGVLGALTLLVLAVGFDRSVYGIVSVVLAAFSVGGVLACVRLMERWV